MKKYLALALVLSLLAPISFPSPLLSATDSDAGIDSERGEGNEAEAAAREAAVREAAAREAAARDKAREAAAEVSAAAAAAGISGSLGDVSAVDPKGDLASAGNSVSIGGKQVSKEAALGAISALGEANKQGKMGHVNASATLSGYANGSLKGGQVKGNHGYTGTAREVADLETQAITRENAVSLARSLSVSPVTGSVAAEDIGAAYRSISVIGSIPAVEMPSSVSHTNVGVISTPGVGLPDYQRSFTGISEEKKESVINAYNEYARSMQPTGLTNLSDYHDYVTYNPVDRNFRSMDGATVETSAIPNGNQIAEVADSLEAIGRGIATMTYEPRTDKVHVTNTYTGYSISFDNRSVQDIVSEVRAEVGDYTPSPSLTDTIDESDLAKIDDFIGKVIASQDVKPVPADKLSANPQYDIEAMAALGIAEAASLGINDVVKAMESVINRSLAWDQTVVGVITANKQYEPYSVYGKNLDAMIADKRTSPHWDAAVAAAKSMVEGTHVYTGLPNTDNQGITHFFNERTVQQRDENGQISYNTSKWTGAMAADNVHTITSVNPTRPGIQHTYGVAPGTRTTSWTGNYNESTDIDSVATNDVEINVGVTAPRGPRDNTSSTGSDPAPGNSPTTQESNNQDRRDRIGRDIGSALGVTLGNSVGGPVGGIVGGLLGGWLGERAVGLGIRGTDGNLSPLSPDNQTDGTPVCNPDCQEASLIGAARSYDAWLNLFKLLFTPVPQTEKTLAAEESKATVLITVNNETDEIELDRLDILDNLKNPAAYYDETELAVLTSLMAEENPVLFDNQGKVVYSNGLYSAAIIDGAEISEADTVYSYLVQYMDEQGNVVSLPEGQSDGVVDGLIRKLATPSAAIFIEDINQVTYRLVDPKEDVPRDEYYDYVVTLKDGSTRATTVPQFTSTSYMEERFKEIGYRGELSSLLAIAKETTEEHRSLISRLIETVKNWAGKFTQAPDNDEQGVNLGDLIEQEITVNDIESLFIYPAAQMSCPANEGYQYGFMYMAVIRDRNNPEHLVTINDGLCGPGNLNEMAVAAALELEQSYGIKEAFSETIASKIRFNTNVVPYRTGVISAYVAAKDSPVNQLPDNNTPSPPSTPPTPVATSSPNTKPNLTNTISLEVKAVGSDGSVVKDWSVVDKLTIGSGVQLYFRWDGSDYGQCLPFLQDGGNYALTRQDRAMLRGNTESERYNLPERSATYRVECGGQRNDEFGVDERRVEVGVE